MSLEGLLAVALGTAVSQALQPGTVVGSAIGGIIGNRVDAGFLKGFNGAVRLLGGGDRDVNQKLLSAVRRSIVAAQRELIEECLKDVHLKEQADERWLQERLERIGTMELGSIDPSVLGNLLMLEVSEGAEEPEVLEEVRSWLARLAIDDLAPVRYKEMIKAGLLQRMVYQHFIQEIAANPELRRILDSQLLVQIDNGVLTVDRLVRSLQVTQEQLLTEIRELREELAILLPQPPVVMIDVRVELPLNPFAPLNTPVYKASEFFPQDRVIDRVLEDLNSGSNVALIGEQGIGKSSLLQEIKRISGDRLRRQAIYVDWDLVRNEETFWEIVCDAIPIAYCTNNQLIRQLQARQLLLLLDQVESMERTNFSEDVRQNLRGFAQGSNMKIVIAANQSLDLLFPMEAHSLISVFNNQCREERVTGWDEPIIRSYITQRLQGNPIQFKEVDIQEVMVAGGIIPRKLVDECFSRYRSYQEGYENRG